MASKPTYEELLKKIDSLEAENKRLKSIEAELIDREQRLIAFLNATTESMILSDKEGIILAINETAAKRLGKKVDDLIGVKVKDIIPPEIDHSRRKIVDQIFLSGKPVKYQDQRAGKILDNSLFPVFDESGNVKAIASFTRDITKSVEIENKLKHAYEIMNKSPVVIFQWKNEKGLPVEFVSDNVEKIFGYAPEEFLNGDIDYLDTVHPDDLEMVLKDGAGFGITHEINDFKPEPYRIKTKNGEIKWVEVFPFRHVDSDNKVTHYQSLVIDITERIKSEQERKKIEDQLRQSQKMEVVGTLASGVAHDLNNILSGMVSYPELILMDLPEDSPLRRPINTIKQSGEKAAVIVQDLLTLARRGVAITQVLNLNDIITDLKSSPEFQNLKLYHPGVKIVFELEMPLQNIKGSSTHISKSVMNLIFNAAESIEDMGRITVSTASSYIDIPEKGYNQIIEKGEYVTISIEDTGAGISEIDLAKIFEPFYTKKVMGRSGTGLGMPVVWGTVKDHKGFIDIKTTEGRGSVFTLYFPVTEADLKGKISRDINVYNGKGESILVVDDVLEQREIACIMLEKLGYSASSVSSGEEAIDNLKKNHADLVILDMIMDPGIDGLETYKNIAEFKPDQKIIIASGYSETDKVKEFQSLVGSSYVKKPYSLREIGKAVKEELQRNNISSSL